MNEIIRNIEVETFKVSLQSDRELSERSIGFALSDYEVFLI